MSTQQTLSGYIKQLQALEAEGHGELPLCVLTEDGWSAMTVEAVPYVAHGDYEAATDTRWSFTRGPHIVA